MADDSLFRPEAVAAVRQQAGGPVDNRGLANWIIVAFMSAVFAGAAIFLVCAQYSKKETVLGAVVPREGVVRVAPLRAGLVKTVWVHSGDFVSKDQPLFALSFDPVLENGDALGGGINRTTDDQLISNTQQGISRKQEIVQSRIEMQAKLKAVRDDIVRVAQERALQADRVALLQKNVDAISPLIEKHFISEFEYRARQDNLLQAKQALMQMDQSVEQMQNQIPQLQAQIAANRQLMAETEANISAGRAQIEERRLTNLSGQGGQIVALTAGQITNVQVKQGDLVSPSQTLGLIVPRNAHQVQQVNLWVPSRAIGFVQLGNKVRLMFDAFPYQTYGVGSGRVSEISTAPIMPTEIPIPIDTHEQMYRIVVDLDRNTLDAYGRTWALKPGMRLSADLILEEKSLFGWLFDPLMAVRKRGGR
jgi:membrane fusion protein